MIGNGDVIAMDPTYGLRARAVGGRRPLAKKLNAPVPGGSYHLVACSMSPNGTDLAIAMTSAVGSNVVLLHRDLEDVPPAVPVGATPAPRGAVPQRAEPFGPVDRTMDTSRGGRVVLKLDGDLSAGAFSVAFQNFSPDGVHTFAGGASFETGGGGFRHVADVRRVGLESQEDVNIFYRADMQVDWPDGLAAAGTTASAGTIASVSRSGDCAAAWDGTTFAPQEGWNAGNRGPRPVPGTRRCRPRRRV
jgi:hypothetical protein